jgi:hypothetical protein
MSALEVEDAVSSDLARATGLAEAAEESAKRLNRVLQLTGFSDPVYAEAYVTVHQYDIVLDVTVLNRWGVGVGVGVFKGGLRREGGREGCGAGEKGFWTAFVGPPGRPRDPAVPNKPDHPHGVGHATTPLKTPTRTPPPPQV